MRELQSVDDRHHALLHAQRLLAARDYPGAETVFRLLLTRQADWQVLQGLALALHGQGRAGDAAEVLRDVDRAGPYAGGLLAQRSAFRLAAGDAPAAEADAREALRHDAGHFGATFNLGLALERQVRLEDAMAAYEQALSLRPEAVAVRIAALEVALALGMPTRARQHAQGLDAGHGAAARRALARLAFTEGRPEETLRWLDDEAVVGADRATLLLRVDALLQLGRTREEIATLRALRRRWPDDRGLALRLINRLHEGGEPEAAHDEFATLVARHPDDGTLYSAFLVLQSYRVTMTAEDLLQCSRRHPLARATVPRRRVATSAKRRWGFVSPRFHEGPVASLLLSVLTALRERGVQVFLYYISGIHDDTTVTFRSNADQWRVLGGNDDVAAGAVIAADGLDVLFDLCGHSPGGRPGLFLQRPAALQLCWLDYFATTGLAVYDAVLLDRWLCPEGEERCYTEPVVRLPRGRLCYAPPEAAPAPAAFDPQLRWFGSFNRMNKLNDVVLDDWAALLRALPSWRLRLKGSGYDRHDDHASLLARFAERGVAAARIDFAPWSDHADTLRAYRDIAIALDTHPFSGCATTLDALWMGVPVLTRRGETLASRQSTALLGAIGQSGWSARDSATWLQCGVALANDVALRGQFRSEARTAVTAGLCDAAAFADDLIAAVEGLPRHARR